MRPPSGWKLLTRHQPETLAAIIRYSKAHADLVPTPSALATTLGITEPAARQRIRRLKSYFTQKQGILRVDVERLCTRKESALFLLTIQSMSPKDTEGRVFKEEVSKELVDKYGNDFADPRLINCLCSKGIETGYLIKISEDCVRPGEFITYQFDYLEIIASG